MGFVVGPQGTVLSQPRFLCLYVPVTIPNLVNIALNHTPKTQGVEQRKSSISDRWQYLP